MTNKYEFKVTEQDDDIIEGVANKRVITFSFEVDSADVWAVPLASFVDFLGSMYGYNIRNSIIIKTNMPTYLFESVSPDEPSPFPKETFDKYTDDLK
jgi:hypothetical protein